MTEKSERRKPFSVAPTVPVNGTDDGHTVYAEAAAPETDLSATMEQEPLSDDSPESTSPLTVPRKKLFIDSEDDLEDDVDAVYSCRVQRPSNAIVFRTRPGKEWRAEALVVDFRQDDPELAKGKYLVVGDMQPRFKDYGRRVLLVTCISSLGEVFLWDVNIVRGFGDTWYKSDLGIIRRAETEWTRFMGTRGNVHWARKSNKNLGEPRWPGPEIKDVYDLALLAFTEDHLVENMRHKLCDFYEIE